MDRREFLKKSGLLIAGGGLLAGSETAAASEGKELPPETLGVLVDTTLCIGCRQCEKACHDVNDLKAPEDYFVSSEKSFDTKRKLDTEAFTVVNRYDNVLNPSKPVFCKKQCMHCNEPACQSACIVGALKKVKNGPVEYTEWKCIGCRYCMMACPFTVPTFEFNKPIQPRVRKCTFCQPRLDKGLAPACVAACPQGVMTLGRREELAEVAKERILRNPGRYQDKIYGLHEGGGTSWMYMASVPFEHLQFPPIGEESPTAMSETLMHSVFKKMIPPLSIVTVLGASMWIFTRKSENGHNE